MSRSAEIRGRPNESGGLYSDFASEVADADVRRLRAEGAAGRTPALRRSRSGADSCRQGAGSWGLYLPPALLLRAGDIASGLQPSPPTDRAGRSRACTALHWRRWL